MFNLTGDKADGNYKNMRHIDASVKGIFIVCSLISVAVPFSEGPNLRFSLGHFDWHFKKQYKKMHQSTNELCSFSKC